jgi:hypothetical protein
MALGPALHVVFTRLTHGRYYQTRDERHAE